MPEAVVDPLLAALPTRVPGAAALAAETGQAALHLAVGPSGLVELAAVRAAVGDEQQEWILKKTQGIRGRISRCQRTGC